MIVLDEDVSARLDNTRGLIDRPDGEKLAELAAMVDPEHAIVEIGSHTGLSTVWMGAGTRGAHIFCVDPWPDPIGMAGEDPFELGQGNNVIAEFWHNVDRFGYRDRITPLRAKSLDIASMWLQPVGLVFIDAMHGYGDVLDDATAWMEKVVPDGWIAFHDWFDDPGRTRESQVADAVRDSVVASGDFEDYEIGFNLWTARRK